MKKKHDNDLPLSLDPEENLRMENQLLELKLKAQFGVQTFPGSDLPPVVEHEFLKNVLEFENRFSQAEETKISEILGSPRMAPEDGLDDLQVELFLKEVIELLQSKNIEVDFSGSYDSRTKYKFIIEELFDESVFYAGIPGMVMHFIYEEFHPDHKVDLENKAKKFIKAWFEKDPEKLLWELNDHIILPEGSTLSKEKIKEKLQILFSRYNFFSDCKSVVADINFEVIDDAGMAYAEGVVSYNASMSTQEAIAIQGPFKFYFCLEYGWWDIFYFVFPGFEVDNRRFH